MSVVASGRWSPVSFKGLVYEFNRGVYVISRMRVYKDNIDNSYRKHHASSTVQLTKEIVMKEYPQYSREVSLLDSVWEKPFEAGVVSSRIGNVVVQFEGDRGLVFLPNQLNEYQISKLVSIVRPRDSFIFSIYMNGDIMDDITSSRFLSFLENYRQILMENQFLPVDKRENWKNKSIKKDNNKIIIKNKY